METRLGGERYDSAGGCYHAEFTASSGSGDSCPRINTCFDTDEPTALPTPAPMACEHERKWHVFFNPYACTNRDNPRGALFNSAEDCCEETFDVSSGYCASRRTTACSDTDNPSALPTPAPTSCKHNRK